MNSDLCDAKVFFFSTYTLYPLEFKVSGFRVILVVGEAVDMTVTT